ncbi:OmpA family protein [Chitinophaga sp. SYP-B3965]|uniref:OmpA family protein n=1 Tax=Chitinophaga sp. SYP-B3965 TaxID=2663120 RepID=UPI00129979DB|nr:OmpA family protein [Chitinophaga sp. SYP-B3965]MRG45783.1 OmpA family protein [Chitinophaga sp. SYP-B3965]
MTRFYSIVLFFLFVGVQGYGQYILKKADEFYDQFRYADAIPLYQKAYQSKITLHAAEHLADCYRLNNDYQQAEHWYEIAITLQESKARNRLYYARALHNNGKFTEARQQYTAYAEADNLANRPQVEAWIASCDSARWWMSSPTGTEITNMLKFNSPATEWGIMPYDSGLVFVSDRLTIEKRTNRKQFLKFDLSEMPDHQRFPWTGNGYQRLYASVVYDTTVRGFSTIDPQNFHAEAYHIGPCSFSAHGRQVYFAFTPVSEKNPKSTAKKIIVRTGIYYSEVDSSGKWSSPAAVPFNDPGCDVTDPFVSLDGGTLYFSANFPQGAGGMDIYYSSRLSNGSWGPPVNMKVINTPANERTPYMTSDSVLYFASDGHIGIGGLDIFRLQNDGIYNLGFPVNSPQDDFNYIVVDTVGVAYFTSNRYGGAGSDDIYRAYTPPMNKYLYLSKVVDVMGDPISSADVAVKGTSLKTVTAADGKFNFTLEKQNSYALNVLERGKAVGWMQVSEDGTSSPANLIKVEVNRSFRLNIHYEYKDWSVRDQDNPSLDQLAAFLKTHPDVYIVVASFTDSRGNDEYNMKLSQKRAGSIVDYLVSKDIDRGRLNPIGYGETRLLNKCGDNVDCTEEEHQQNRRAEFWVVKQ